MNLRTETHLEISDVDSTTPSFGYFESAPKGLYGVAGCTSDAYKCIQLHVKYKPAADDWRPAVLYVNIKGCGYPPTVNCENFTINYGYVGARYHVASML